MSIEPEVRRENETFIFDYPDLGITCELSRLDMGKAEAHALLFVKTTLPGFDPIVSFDKRLLLTPSAGFTTMAKYLTSRLDLPAIKNVTWESVLEKVAGMALMTVRESGRTVWLGEIPDRTTPIYSVAPLSLYNERVILYGDGGTGKSTLAMTIALAYRTGLTLAELVPYEQGQVLYLDWESDAETVQWRMKALSKGFGIEHPIMAYKQCFQPLTEIADAIGREIHENGYGMILIDSVTWAVAGSAKDDDAVLPMFNAMRRWNCHVVCVDHVTGDKAKEADRPYGSVFKRNAARLLWNVRLAPMNDDYLHVGLYASKGNFTGKQKPIGFRLRYVGEDEQFPESIEVEREDINKQFTARSGPASSRCIIAITEAKQPLTAGEVMSATDLKEKTAYNTLGLLVKQHRLVQVVVSGEERRWSLPVLRDVDHLDFPDRES